MLGKTELKKYVIKTDWVGYYTLLVQIWNEDETKILDWYRYADTEEGWEGIKKMLKKKYPEGLEASDASQYQVM